MGVSLNEKGPSKPVRSTVYTLMEMLCDVCAQFIHSKIRVVFRQQFNGQPETHSTHIIARKLIPLMIEKKKKTYKQVGRRRGTFALFLSINLFMDLKDMQNNNCQCKMNVLSFCVCLV